MADSEREPIFSYHFCQTVFTPSLWTVTVKTRQTLDTTHYEKQCLLTFLNKFEMQWGTFCHFSLAFLLVKIMFIPALVKDFFF